MSWLATRQQMVVEQLQARGIRDRRVLEAMMRVPREKFLPEELKEYAYDDRALPIDCRQTISQPYIVALMAEALELTGNERVLDVGTGSGYQAAVLSHLAKEVISIERHAPLSRAAAQKLAELGYENVECVVGDGTLGWPAKAPYQGILVAAAAAFVPPALIEQLDEGGRLVIPVGDSIDQMLRRYRKKGEHVEVRDLGPCRFVPLIGAQQPPPTEQAEEESKPPDPEH